MGFRYDFQKKRKSRGKTEKEVERGVRKGYKSPWSPIKFMNLDLDRSSVVTVLKYFFLSLDTFFALLLPASSTEVSTARSIGGTPFCSSTIDFSQSSPTLEPLLLNRSLDTKP